MDEDSFSSPWSSNDDTEDEFDASNMTASSNLPVPGNGSFTSLLAGMGLPPASQNVQHLPPSDSDEAILNMPEVEDRGVNGGSILGSGNGQGIAASGVLHEGGEVSLGMEGHCDDPVEVLDRQVVVYSPSSNILEMDVEEPVDECDGGECVEANGTDDDELEITGSLIGVQRQYWTELYDLYRRHASIVGFSVRKSTTRRRDIGGELKLSEKYFLCSCEGTNEGNKRATAIIEHDTSKKRRKRRVPTTRTGCGAHMRVQLQSNGMFEVVGHVTAHNHRLTRTEWQHHHRQERAITESKAESIQLMTKSSMKTATQYNYMVEDFGGVEFLGHTKKDHYNYVHRLKVKQIEGGDAQNLFNILQGESSSDPDFFYRVKLDSSGRMCNVFWADSMMKEDYRIYGDVLVFDTTYRTNRYNLICGAFVGINNHWKNVMFGCAFIGDEKVDSFEWLFGVFKECMDGVCPTTIFTDQDHAMSSALSTVFPTTRHRLCQWHIHQNAISHFGRLKSDRNFNAAFTKCLRGCFTEEQFEVCWAEMIRSYGLEHHHWFQRLYGLKSKWCTALSRDFFSAGILSSQRSESTNSSLSFQASKTTSLSEFYKIYSATLMRWRQTEQKDEFDCSRSTPTSDLRMAPLLKHASEVYTLSLFRIFEQEFADAIAATVEIIPEDGTHGLRYKIYHYGCEAHGHIVGYDRGADGVYVTCSCKNFEVCGWLCFHAIRVLHLHSVNTIPDRYVLRRWTRFAKSDVWERTKGKMLSSLGVKKDAVPWRYMMTRSYYNLVSRCYNNPEARKIIESGYTHVLARIEDLFAKTQPGDTSANNTSNSVEQDSNRILDPPHANTKGRRARKKAAIEGKNRKKRTTTAEDTTIDIIRPLNPRLF